MPIRYLPYGKIDKKKWDKCIEHSQNGLIYAYSFYLDAMAEQWDALVLEDYEYVMPLTWRRKYGIFYLYQPFFCASLGIFSKNKITPKETSLFFNSVPEKFQYWDISLNYANNFSEPGTGFYERVNYVLNLNKPYKELYAGFSTNVKRNIKKAESLNCIVKKNIELKPIVALSKEQLQAVSSISNKDFTHFSELYKILWEKEKAVTYAVYSANNEIMASCVFFFSHNRAYYILVGNHPEGKKMGASHLLINAFIKEHAGKKLLLDFEGSDLRNLALFYSSFGATREKYSAIKLNRLPPLVRWIKK